MTILTQNYTKLLEGIIKNKINNKFNISSISSLTMLLKDISITLSYLIRESIVELFETIDNEFKNSIERKNKYYYKNKFKRTITTMFGDITFNRYYYYNKHDSKEHFFYIDELFKIKKYDKYDPLIKAWLIEEKSKGTFQKAGDVVTDRIKEMTGAFIYISKQQVYSIFKKFNLPELQEKAKQLFYNQEINEDTLYVMLDEKYVHLQRDEDNNICKDNVMVKHAVIYTNVEKESKTRNKLMNKHVFSTKGSTMNLIEDVQAFIDCNYKDKSIQNVVISGDGANWIKTFDRDFTVFDCKKKIFILDSFHANQAVNRIVLLPEERKALRDFIYHNKKDDFKLLINGFKLLYPERIELITKHSDYIISNWRYIQNQKFALNKGCSMEGHISHNLAKHFTRDPKAYSFNNIDKHTFLRDLYINKKDIKQLMLHNLILEENNFENIIYGCNKKTNVPILNGQVTGTSVLLKKIAH